jgi:hypothetical protein
VNFVVDCLRIGDRSGDFLSQKLAVSFSQSMNQRLYSTQTNLKLIRYFLIRR